MALQSVFDSLIPYFVRRTVLETQLEERKQAVTDAQAAGKEAKRAYHRAMDDLEKISLEIQAEQANSARRAPPPPPPPPRPRPPPPPRLSPPQ